MCRSVFTLMGNQEVIIKMEAATLDTNRIGNFTRKSIQHPAGPEREPVSIMPSDLSEKYPEAGQETVDFIEDEQLKAIKHLVVSLNHEINNPLSSLMLNAELLKRSPEPLDPNIDQRLSVILREGQRIAQFVRNLNKIESIVLKNYVNDSIKMLDVERSIERHESVDPISHLR